MCFLRNHGMSDDSLRHVYKAIVLCELLSASPVWRGFTSAADKYNVLKHQLGVLFVLACTRLMILRFYARQLYTQVLLRARISYGNSVCPSVRHDPVRI